MLDPEQLVDELGVSRTVVREALRVLTAKGLVAARPKVGTYVRDRADWRTLDPDMLRWRYETATDFAFLDSLAEVRRIIEPAGAELAARRRTDGDLAIMRDALAQMEQAHADRDSDAATAADLVFHRTLLAAGHNELLEQMEMVIAAGLRVRDRLVHDRPDWDDATPTTVPSTTPSPPATPPPPMTAWSSCWSAASATPLPRGPSARRPRRRIRREDRLARDVPRRAPLAVPADRDRRRDRRLGRAGRRRPRRDGAGGGAGAERAADRPRPAADRGPLADAHQERLLPRRADPRQRRRRDRPGALGHRRQGARRPRPRTARRTGARSRARLRLGRRRRARRASPRRSPPSWTPA